MNPKQCGNTIEIATTLKDFPQRFRCELLAGHLASCIAYGTKLGEGKYAETAWTLLFPNPEAKEKR